MEANKSISIINYISERQDIIERYNIYGQLDRENAIKKIQSLRMTDANVAEATAVSLVVNSVPFTNASDETIISELKFQIEILSTELATMG